MKLRMYILLSIALFTIILCLGIGYFIYTNISKDNAGTITLKYKFAEADRLVYSIVYNTDIPTGMLQTNIDLFIKNTSDNDTNLIINSSSIVGNSNITNLYNITLDLYGNIIKQDSLIPIIPEICPESPIHLVYPSKAVKENDSWTNAFNKTGIYNSSGYLIEYNVSGTTINTYIGKKNISTNSGDFNCAGIQSYTIYTVNQNLTNSKGSIYYMTKGNFSGTVWVDLEKGFTISSYFDKNEVLVKNVTAMYGGAFESVNQVIPSKSSVTSELESVYDEEK
ncbi:hypothetical protein [Methanocella conradii]|uniref:hypothetical protein n=1 Tax=Methanocella conradii TaxID=1175444 RepID=UPI0024B37FAD|nr:hypothetical protein [Methanocella conradii]MDI6898192.1 hypothetical protein [Methanocella conradii]